MTPLKLSKSFLLGLLIGMSTLAAERVTVVRTPGDGEVPDAEIDANGTIHVAYVAGEDAYYVTSKTGAKAFSKPLRINSEPRTVHPANMFRGPDLAIGQNGRLHVIWYVNAYQRKLPHDQWGVFYSHIDPGQKEFARAINLNHKPSDNYSLAANAQGNVSVIWMAEKLFVHSSKDNGETFLTAEPVGFADPCECCASRAAYSNNGSLLIDYREKASNIRDMFLLARAPGENGFRREKISGTPWEVTGCPMTGTFLSEQVVAWETKGQISYARVDPASGQLRTKEIKVAERGKWPVALAAGDGTVLVSWKHDSKLNWQLFDRSDRPSGNPGSKQTPNSARHAGVTTIDGNFVLID